MPMKINNQFAIGDKVYIKTEPEQNEYIILYITITPTGLLYGIRLDGEEASFWDIELSTDKKLY